MGGGGVDLLFSFKEKKNAPPNGEPANQSNRRYYDHDPTSTVAQLQPVEVFGVFSFTLHKLQLCQNPS